MELLENERQKSLPVITIILVGINVLAYVMTEATGSSLDAEHLIAVGAMYEPAVTQDHEWYRLLTHFFLHSGMAHLMNNMISLSVLGYALEDVVGKISFLAIYLFSGVAAGLISMWYRLSYEQATVSCGASGAIFGLMGALLVLLLIDSRGRMRKSILRYTFFIMLSLYSGSMDPGIDNAAHVGGFLGGAILCAVLCIRRPTYWKGEGDLR